MRLVRSGALWLAALALCGTILLGSTAALAQKGKYVIALSNAYYGNTWRHQMVQAFQQAAEQAKQQGLIANYVILNGDNTVNQQMAQMSDLILKHVDAIAINAASLTALNGVIQKACAAGIKVVAFDSIASAPCAIKLDWDFKDWKGPQTEWIARKIGGKGNVIIVRGVKGSAPDQAMYDQQLAVLKKYPDIKVVAMVYGMASTSVAQSAIANVLPSLPHIDAVLAQGGGDDYGIAQAFEQFGGPYKDKLPVIDGGGSANFIRWWSEQHQKTGYSTISMNTAPGIGGAAFWLALDALHGQAMPKTMLMQVATVTDADLPKYANLKPGTIVSPVYTNDWVEKHLIAQGK